MLVCSECGRRTTIDLDCALARAYARRDPIDTFKSHLTTIRERRQEFGRALRVGDPTR